ncbi:hypothetical protein CALCODRAFT_9671 [Calocera cornea HHB12733]|uniref:ATP-dependent DNA ligase family profile domain-containing protein n=1 Tax=Calocera cornea HHB12733 TaxID=1353952 RepID=A0A165J5V6_9BASI|nr:hypothetical protein CALCODRAFT_9671 [Calocera cornea HHB12733]
MGNSRPRAHHQYNAVPFNFFSRLIEEFGKVKPENASRRSSSASSAGKSRKHMDVLQSWLARLDHPLCPGTGTAFFHFLFPEEDMDRKYNMQEAKLSRLLADVFVVDATPGKRGHRLACWKESAEGCLGREVQLLLEETYSGLEHPTEPTFQQVDALLDELAATSQWSNLSNCSTLSEKRPVKEILRDLYHDLTPLGAAVMTQIILKDLRPLCYIQPSIMMSSSLLRFNSNSYEEITVYMAMRAWHPQMCNVYKTNSKLDTAARAVEELQSVDARGVQAVAMDLFSPKLGVPVEIPKCVKGHSCGYAMQRLSTSDRLYAETKYDGERMQIHFDLSRPAGSEIQIFSKSKRDSTADRVATHSILRATLGLSPGPDAHPKLVERIGNAASKECIVSSAIFDAEMVAYSELSGDIDKFWRIRGMIGATASGIRRKEPRRSNPDFDLFDSEDETKVDPVETQDSLVSNGTASDTRHFMLVFFDILHLNGQNLLDRPYEHRRLVLKQLITPISGFSRVARSVMILRKGPKASAALDTLEHHFKRETAHNKEEGIVLKAGDSVYNDRHKPWIKIKRDYIRGYGDTLDLVVLGAGWNKRRGRELRVGPSVNTSFYVGCITNMEEVKLRRSVRPHFEVYFTVEYGLSREQLEDLNAQMQCGSVPFKPENTQGLPYSFNLMKGIEPPRCLFNRPMLMELMGDRFTKAAGTPGYELRFPRITKVWRRDERDWMDGVSLQELRRIAREALHRTPDVIASTVNVPTSPAIPKDAIPSNRKRLHGIAEDSLPIKRLRSITNHPSVAVSTEHSASHTWILPEMATHGEQHRNTRRQRHISDKENQSLIPYGNHSRRRNADSSSPPTTHKGKYDRPRPLLDRGLSGFRSWAAADNTLATLCYDPPYPRHAASSAHGRARDGAEHDTPSLREAAFLGVLRQAAAHATRDSIGETALCGHPSLDRYLSSSFADAAIWIDGSIQLGLHSAVPTTDLFSTLEALLIATGWFAERKLPIRTYLNRGIIFVSHPQAHIIIDTLITMQQTLEARKEDVRLRLLVCSAEQLEECTRNTEHVLQPLWISA